MKTKILQLLRSDQKYRSGQELCELLDVSRTAIWKVMNQLKEEGYQIEAVQNKGYCLVEAPDLLTESELKSRLTTNWVGQEMKCVAEIGSTNQELKKLAEEGASHGTLFVADVQTAGRGRRGREWESKTGENITMSLLLRPDFEPDVASRLTLVMAVSAAKAIEELTKQSCMIKWPNDILINGRKVSGILTEMSAEMGYIHYIVIGIGINVNEISFPKHLENIATSIQMESGHVMRRSDLILKTMEYFEAEYEKFKETGDLRASMNWYQDHLINLGATVRVESPQGAYEATAIGINEQGELIVEREDHIIERVYAGEVSIRGIAGYV